MDNPTLMYILFIITASLAGMFLVYSFAQKTRVSARYWATSYSLLSAGFFLITLQGEMNPILTVLLANGLITLGYLVNLLGLRRYLKIKTWTAWHIIAVPLQTLLFVLFLYPFPSVSYRIVVISLILSVVTMESGYILIKHAQEQNWFVTRFGMFAFWFSSGYFFLRSILSLQRENSPLLGPAMDTSVYFILINITLMMYAFVFMLLHSTGLEISLRKKIDEIQKLNSSKDQLLSIVGHDLRTPISSMMMLGELLSAKFVPGSCMEIDDEELFVLTHSSQTAMTILEGLLEWGNAQHSLLGYDRAEVNLAHVLQAVLTELRTTAKEKNVEWKLELKEDVVIFGDKRALGIVFRNVMQNALKFAEKGSEVRVSLRDIGQSAAVYVQNRGMVIPEKVIASVADGMPVHSSRGTQGEKGTGLGLVLCKQLIERGGGTLSLAPLSADEGNSEPVGTQVNLVLPLKPDLH